MTFTITLQDKSVWRFEVEEFSIEEDEFIADNVKLFIDGKPYNNEKETWSGVKLDDYDLFEQTLNAYLRKDTEVEYSDDWSIFTQLISKREYKDNLIVRLPILEYGVIQMVDLVLATPTLRYYQSGDIYRVYRPNGELVTDYEWAFMNALDSDVEEIKEGTLKVLYVTPEMQEYIDKY